MKYLLIHMYDWFFNSATSLKSVFHLNKYKKYEISSLSFIDMHGMYEYRNRISCWHLIGKTIFEAHVITLRLRNVYDIHHF